MGRVGSANGGMRCGLRASVVAGILGCCASIFGKLALAPDSVLVQHINASCTQYSGSLLDADNCYYAANTTRILAMVFMFFLNGLLGYYSITALHKEGSTAATVTTTAVNYLCMGLSGWLIFSEHVSQRWWLGAFLIAVGVFLISSSSGGKEKNA